MLGGPGRAKGSWEIQRRSRERQGAAGSARKIMGDPRDPGEFWEILGDSGSSKSDLRAARKRERDMSFPGNLEILEDAGRSKDFPDARGRQKRDPS